MYRRSSSYDTRPVTALGSLSNSTKFAHVQSALNHWNASVVSQ